MKLKRFLVFSGDYYYPSGGWHDFHGSFDTLEEANGSQPKGEWAHIFDMDTGEIVDNDWWEPKIRCSECKGHERRINEIPKHFWCDTCKKIVEPEVLS